MEFNTQYILNIMLQMLLFYYYITKSVINSPSSAALISVLKSLRYTTSTKGIMFLKKFSYKCKHYFFIA